MAESKAAKLGQYFSIMMLVEVAGGGKGCADEMRSLLSSLPDLNVAVFEARETAAATVPSVACTSDNGRFGLGVSTSGAAISPFT